MNLTVDAICAGRAASLANGRKSAIAKSPISGDVAITSGGVEGDEQVDRKHHGFPAMALHLYPADHYAWLRDTFGPIPALSGPGTMGENLHVHGIDENSVCIGDRFRLGTALIEVTQPRQPCATIERHFGIKGVVKAIVQCGRSGFFFRVIEDGTAKAGDVLQLLEKGSPGWSVRRAFHLVYGGGKPDPDELEELAALPRVSDRLVHDIRRKFGVR